MESAMGILGIVGIAIFAVMGFVVAITVLPNRRLPDDLVDKLVFMEPKRPNQHKVTAVLRSGRRVRHVYVGWGRFVNYSFGFRRWLRPRDIVDFERDD